MNVTACYRHTHTARASLSLIAACRQLRAPPTLHLQRLPRPLLTSCSCLPRPLFTSCSCLPHPLLTSQLAHPWVQHSLASPDKTSSDLLWRRRVTLPPPGTCLISITHCMGAGSHNTGVGGGTKWLTKPTCDPRLRETSSPSKAECVSTCCGMPAAGKTPQPLAQEDSFTARNTLYRTALKGDEQTMQPGWLCSGGCYLLTGGGLLHSVTL